MRSCSFICQEAFGEACKQIQYPTSNSYISKRYMLYTVTSVCIAYPCLLKNHQIQSSKISETLSLNKNVAIRRDSFAKIVNVRQNTTLLGYCRKKYVGAKIRKTSFRSNSCKAGNEILIFVIWETVLQTLCFSCRIRQLLAIAIDFRIATHHNP